nr:transcription factor HES-1-like [Rhipicephalus microplus]
MPVASGASPPSPMASGAESKTGGRRVSKPLMEKRRRARINRCLNQLKAFLVDPSKPESPRQSKLEKADILEMTVCHLQALHRQRRTARLLDDPEVRHKFRAGFEECILEIRRFLCSLAEQQHQTSPCFDPVASRERILGHLQRRAREIQDPDGALAQCTSAPAGPDASSDPPVRTSRRLAPNEASTPESNHSSLDATASSDELASETSSSRSPSPSDVVVSHADVRLRPKRLRNGDLVLVLPRDLVANARIVAAAAPTAEPDVKQPTSQSQASTSSVLDAREVSAASTSPEVSSSTSSASVVAEEVISPPVALPSVSSSPTSSTSSCSLPSSLQVTPAVEGISHDDVWRPW